MHEAKHSGCGQRGMTLAEVLVVLAIMGLAIAATALYLTPFEAPVESGATQLAAFMRMSRARAMATTSAYRVLPDGDGAVRTMVATTCSDSTWTPDTDRTLTLPDDVTLASTSWLVCFNSRGISSNNVVITVQNPEFGSEQVEVLLGGSAGVVR